MCGRVCQVAAAIINNYASLCSWEERSLASLDSALCIPQFVYLVMPPGSEQIGQRYKSDAVLSYAYTLYVTFTPSMKLCRVDDDDVMCHCRLVATYAYSSAAELIACSVSTEIARVTRDVTLTAAVSRSSAVLPPARPGSHTDVVGRCVVSRVLTATALPSPGHHQRLAYGRQR